MDLGAGSNSEGTGIGNSRYAFQDSEPRSSLPPTSPIVSLPNTVPYASSAGTQAMLNGLRDIEEKQNVPVIGSDDDMDDTDEDCSGTSNQLIIDKVVRDYKDIKDVIQDFQFLYRSHRALKDVVSTMAEGLDIFKSTVQRLEEDCEGLRLELHLLQGGHAFYTRRPT